MKKLDSVEIFLVEMQEMAYQNSKIRGALLNPEKSNLSKEQIEALKECNFTIGSLSAIESLCRETIENAFFDMAVLLDGIGDPKVARTEKTWVGLRLKEPIDDDEAQYLNEQFYEGYENWLELRKENR